MSLNLAFMGTPDFSVPVLEALIGAGHRIAAVYCQPPRPAGRGQKERKSPVHLAAERHFIPVRTPRSLRNDEEQAAFAALGLDAAIVAAYGLILPKAILDAPRLGCINVHASLLPRWRGAAPIQRSILAGDEKSGVTIMQMDEGLDTGAMLSTRSLPIGPATTGETLHDALSAIGADLLIETLAAIEAGTAVATAQPDDGTTYAAKLAKDEGRLDWTRTAAETERAIRAFSPFPGAFCEWNGERFKVLAATIETGRAEAIPGTLLDDRLLVACGQGSAIRLARLQRAGKSPLDADAFLRGFAFPPGARLCPASS